MFPGIPLSYGILSPVKELWISPDTDDTVAKGAVFLGAYAVPYPSPGRCIAFICALLARCDSLLLALKEREQMVHHHSGFFSLPRLDGFVDIVVSE
jgi:hypothetical protein